MSTLLPLLDGKGVRVFAVAYYIQFVVRAVVSDEPMPILQDQHDGSDAAVFVPRRRVRDGRTGEVVGRGLNIGHGEIDRPNMLDAQVIRKTVEYVCLVLIVRRRDDIVLLDRGDIRVGQPIHDVHDLIDGRHRAGACGLPVLAAVRVSRCGRGDQRGGEHSDGGGPHDLEASMRMLVPH
jgi:hypothetical protein